MGLTLLEINNIRFIPNRQDAVTTQKKSLHDFRCSPRAFRIRRCIVVAGCLAAGQGVGRMKGFADLAR